MVKVFLYDIKEIYYFVCMIQNFSMLNVVVICKIMKKMDKEVGMWMSGIYCIMCDEFVFWLDLKELTFQCKIMAKFCEEAFLICYVLICCIEVMKIGFVCFNI